MTPRLAIVSSQPLTDSDSRLLERLLAGHSLRLADCYAGCSIECLNNRRPNCVLLLGEVAFQWFSPKAGRLADWRGNIFAGSFGLDRNAPALGKKAPEHGVHPAGQLVLAQGAMASADAERAGQVGELGGESSRSSPSIFKCVATWAPSDCLGHPENLALMRFDLKRAVEESYTPDLTLPKRTIHARGDANYVVACLEAVRSRCNPVGHDLEGTASSGISDFSFATSPTEAFWVPLKHESHTPFWMPEEEEAILAAVKAVLEDPSVPKVGHNLAYEGFVWGWCHGITLRGIAEDSMLAWQSAYSELPRALNVVASLLTREPFWGHAGDQHDSAERAAYNCRDSMLPLEIMEAIRALPEWTPATEAHYRGRVSLLPAVIDQMLRGAAFDATGRKAYLAQVEEETAQWQGRLDRLAGIQPPTFSDVIQEVCHSGKVAGIRMGDWADVVARAKPSWQRRAGS